MTAQEDLTGMPTPGPWKSNGYQITDPEGIRLADCWFGPNRPFHVAEANAALIVKAVNAYTSTDALRSALAPILSLPDACVESLRHQRQVDADGCEVGVSRQAVDEIYAAIVAARTALAGVTAPEPDIIEELIIAAYKRGFHWCVENASDPEAAAYVGKAARDYADKTMNAPSAGVTAQTDGD